MQNKIQIEVLVESLVLMIRIVATHKLYSRSRIVAFPYYGMKILVRQKNFYCRKPGY